MSGAFDQVPGPSIHRVVVCGAGTMGSGIAQVVAGAGYPCQLYDLYPQALDRARQAIEKHLTHQVEKGRMTEAFRTETLSRIVFTADWSSIEGDLIIEAVAENEDIKKDILARIEAQCSDEATIATNTSSLPLRSLVTSLRKPERFLGLHFFNPPQVMKLVEVIRGAHTDPVVLSGATEWIRTLGKTPVVCRDAPGFIVNRVARHYYLESLRLVEQGVCTIEVADRLLESAGFPMGPFRLMDLIGNDVNLAVTRSLYEAFGHTARFRPSELQAGKVATNQLGRKTGRGYYEYSSA